MPIKLWKGWVNAPIAADWTCIVCGSAPALMWGLVHGHCRCDKCHAEYTFRDEDDKIVTRPISFVKPEYLEPAKYAWRTWGIPVNNLTFERWERAFAAVGQTFRESKET